MSWRSRGRIIMEDKDGNLQETNNFIVMLCGDWACLLARSDDDDDYKFCPQLMLKVKGPVA